MIERRTMSKWRKPGCNGWINAINGDENWITDGYFAIKSDKIPNGHNWNTVSLANAARVDCIIPKGTAPVKFGRLSEVRVGIPGKYPKTRAIETIQLDNGTQLSRYYVSCVLGLYPNVTWEQGTALRDPRCAPVVAVVDGRPVAIVMPIRE